MAGAGRFRRVALDLAPLRVSPDFRWIWAGLAVSALGAQFSLVGVFVQVTALTGSAAAVGFTGLVWLLALVFGSVGAASILDRWDRRRLLLLAQVGLASGSGILLIGASMDRPPLVLVYAGIAILAGFSAIDSPTRTAMTPRLVGADLLPSAQALNQVVWNTTGLIGPALAGLFDPADERRLGVRRRRALGGRDVPRGHADPPDAPGGQSRRPAPGGRRSARGSPT